ncbi:hypothetical protein ACF08M_40265, partial [Streptomyces sp. NPDC015032]|uniref:hypothetical protein n=1 Tax=Streptomyces sp. NPDC015032 TaxID=3364937 RepID=UPI0036FED6B9
RRVLRCPQRELPSYGSSRSNDQGVHDQGETPEISTIRSNPQPAAAAEKHPSPYEILAARNAKLRRTNRSLTENLRFAAAQIQRLAVDNARLREALEESTNITRIDRPDRPRGR